MSLLFGWMSPNSAKDYTKEKKPKVLKSKKEKDKKKIATRTPNLQQQQMRKYTHRISHDIFHICFYVLESYAYVFSYSRSFICYALI